MCSLCTVLCIHPVFVLPDFTMPFRIESNAFGTTVGGAFIQKHASVHKPIAFLSKTLTSSDVVINTIVYMTVNCLQLLLVAKLGAPILMGNEL